MNKLFRARLCEHGFTLVEVMVALVLVVLVLAGAYGLVVQAEMLSTVARNHYVAIAIGKNRLERARNFQYASLSLLTESDVQVDDNGAPDTTGRFKRTTAVNTNYAAGLTEVVVTVKIKNVQTGTFGSELERISTLFTDLTR